MSEGVCEGTLNNEPAENHIFTDSAPIIQSLRPIDDVFMRCLFRNNIPLVEEVLRIITGNGKIHIKWAKTQADMKIIE